MTAQNTNEAAFDNNTDGSAPPGAASDASLAEDLKAPTLSRAYQCQCGRPVFLSNSKCLACGTPLGYVVESLGVVPLAPAAFEGAEPDTFTVFGDPNGRAYRRCGNLMTPAACNWMVPAPRPGDDPAFGTEGLVPHLCLSCSVTRTIPDLSVEGNGDLWLSLEQAKRRLLSQLLALHLPVRTRLSDPAQGLAFDFLSHVPGGTHVLTGHQNGVITLNAAEADDAVRERIRAEMREPYRTLLGHFRHEIGHYYWDGLVAPTVWLDGFRELFGDEREDYAAALRTHYDNGPPPDWANRFVTSYASAHPWEDWAETWAHYLHMADTADTAMSFGVDARNVELASDLFELSDLWQPDRPGATRFLDFLNGWVRLTNVLNELSRSMGQPDYYPFVLPRAAVGKLQFIHEVITEARENNVLPAGSQQAQPVADVAPPQPVDVVNAAMPGGELPAAAPVADFSVAAPVDSAAPVAAAQPAPVPEPTLVQPAPAPEQMQAQAAEGPPAFQPQA